ncbi:hypothetical protein J4E91_008858 [Alternaria rosae]|nr:hypothetical protein J4E91_008858 [Alternaria rosae]
MVQYSLILAGLLSATILSAAVPAPQPEAATGLYTIPAAGIANGMYDVDLNEDGTTRFTLIDAADTTPTLQSRNLLFKMWLTTS